MKPFISLTAIAAPIEQSDINTDRLFPQRFGRKPRSIGYADFFFHNDRFSPSGEKKPEFILNRAPYDKAQILVTGSNFGCGSTREGAVYSAVDFGIRAIVSPSFGAFYATNCFQNGLLPVLLEEKHVLEILRQLSGAPGAEVSIDLPSQTVVAPKGQRYAFEIQPSRKERMLEGLDDISATKQYERQLAEYEKRLAIEKPWLEGNVLKEFVQS